jgi:THUMP domain-like/RNA cap guanine-N2 methyltransferase
VGLAGSPESSSVELLLGADGPAVLAAAAAEAGSGSQRMGLHAGEILRKSWPADLVSAALTQLELRAKAVGKFHHPERLLFTRAGLEQASSARVAAHRAARFAPYDRVADLCTGIGGDLLALAAVSHVLAVDRDPVHLRLAVHNAVASGLGDRVTGWLGDVEAADLTGVQAAFVDPARRLGGRRLASADGSPSLHWCADLAQRMPVGVKAAPGIDHAHVPTGWELEFVAQDGDLKEAALWSPGLASAARRATVINGDDVHSLVGTDAAATQVLPPGPFVLDPSPAVTRAGLVADLAVLLAAWQLDPMIAFLCAATPTPTPYGRWLQVEASLPWNLKALAAALRAADVGAVDLRRRGLAGDVEDIRRRLKLRGSRRVTVLMTRVKDKPWALVGTPVQPTVT